MHKRPLTYRSAQPPHLLLKKPKSADNLLLKATSVSPKNEGLLKQQLQFLEEVKKDKRRSEAVAATLKNCLLLAGYRNSRGSSLHSSEQQQQQQQQEQQQQRQQGGGGRLKGNRYQ